EFAEAFFGCLYAGVIAVPAYAPLNDRALERVSAIAADAGVRAALTTRLLSPKVAAQAGRRLPAGLSVLASDDAAGDRPPSVAPRLADPADLAYLHYPSGSTSEPKGVRIHHANVMANSESIRRGFEHGPSSRSLCWLPHFHDMGLIDGVIQPVFSGHRAVL